MPRQWEFALPTRIYFGRGTVRKLGEIARALGTRALLVGYRERAGLEAVYAKAAESLRKAGVSAVELFDVPPDPDAELADSWVPTATGANVDVVVALGGGSAIDAAKGIAAVAEMGGRLWDYANANPEKQPITDSLPVVAVPTTAGTGSEVTPVAVFSFRGVGSMPQYPLKSSVSGPAVRPKVAIVDPDLAVGSPAELTAACGADALGHAIEASMSRRRNPISSTLAGRAVSLIVRHLPAAVQNPADPELREHVALAATLAGVAFSEAGVTMTHAIAQALGALLHVPHGTAVAVGTPLNLKYNLPECTEVYDQLGHYSGVRADEPGQRAAQFVERINRLLREVGLPEKVPVPADAPAELAALLARNACESTPVPLKLNPRKVDEPTLKQLFEEILCPS